MGLGGRARRGVRGVVRERDDEADTPPRPGPPGRHGGYGLTLVEALASRWNTARDGDRNVTWFELDLPAPGA